LVTTARIVRRLGGRSSRRSRRNAVELRRHGDEGAGRGSWHPRAGRLASIRASS
jgi:hypothetical protein